MVTNDGPDLIYLQVKAIERRKRALGPELLDRFRRQDQRVFDLLVRYRAGEAVAEAMLAELLPAVDSKAARMSPVGLYGRQDLRQELIAEVLYVARRLPLTRPNFVTRRLMLAAAKRLSRRLEREWHRQLDHWYRELSGRSRRVSAQGAPEDFE
jgi:hypothetical protein